MSDFEKKNKLKKDEVEYLITFFCCKFFCSMNLNLFLYIFLDKHIKFKKIIIAFYRNLNEEGEKFRYPKRKKTKKK